MLDELVKYKTEKMLSSIFLRLGVLIIILVFIFVASFVALIFSIKVGLLLMTASLLGISVTVIFIRLLTGSAEKLSRQLFGDEILIRNAEKTIKNN